MKKRKNEKRKYTFIIIFLLIDLLAILAIFNTSNARFTSKATSETSLNVALYALSQDNNLDIVLDNMVPRSEPYKYTFSIYNSDGKNRTETRLEYDLKIIATTNIPLEYKLCVNNLNLCETGENIIKVDEITTDDDGTKFRVMTTDSVIFDYDKDEKNDYTLLIYFPKKYNSSIYQDLVESVQVNVESCQIID